MSWTPPPGTVSLTHLPGLSGYRASLGQRLLGPTDYNHAFVVLDEGYIIEPWPSGARIRRLADYDDAYVAYCWLHGLTDRQRIRVADAALELEGVRHGLTDYVALSLYRSGWRGGQWADRVSDAAHLTPAQFVVEAYWRAGIYLMPDRDPHDVSLDQLGELFLRANAWEVRIPCVQYV